MEQKSIEINEKKQIEEMAKVMMKHCKIDNLCGSCRYTTCDECLADTLCNAGYRKQKEGEWISNELGGYKYAFYCSECRWVDGYPFNERHKYCPNCGAKMKGEQQ